jgi:alpha-tubulin suppressor-like RCC1 family protein
VLSSRRVLIALAVACFLLVAMVGMWQPAGATFSDTTTNGPSSFSAAADFESGTLSTWGGTHVQSTRVQIGTVSTWATVATSVDFDCAIRTDGTLWCSGHNVYGTLGQGDTVSRPVLTQVGTATTWTTVGVGSQHACAMRSDTTLWCWGSNFRGLIGDGTTTQRTTPVEVGAGTPLAGGWAALGAGVFENCASRLDTTLYCWGNGNSGQLGDGTSTERHLPTQVTIPSATGWGPPTSGDRQSCAIRTGGLLYCWGQSANGQLGQGDTVAHNSPVQIPGTTWSVVTAGTNHTCATKTDGTLWCWGQNANGQIGNATTVDALSPVQIGSATTWQQMTAGASHTCGVQTDGTLWCWGFNGGGRLGLGDTTARTSPVQVTSPFSNGWASTGTGVSASGNCAIRTNGTLWCSGPVYGLVSVPTAVDAVTTWRRPANGLDYTCALRATGALYCWGLNGSGQLGINNTTAQTAPVQVGTATTWTSVSAGTKHTCGIQSDTTLWCWGDNTNGRLGIGSTTQQLVPTQVTFPSTTGWAQVTLGTGFTCAVRTTGTLLLGSQQQRPTRHQLRRPADLPDPGHHPVADRLDPGGSGQRVRLRPADQHSVLLGRRQLR